MNKLFSILLVLSFSGCSSSKSSQKNIADNIDYAEVSSCSLDSDCTLTKDPCGEIKSINQSYLKKIDTINRKVSQVINCADLVDRSNLDLAYYLPYCHKSKCDYRKLKE